MGHFAKVCRSKLPQPDTTPTAVGANALSLLSTIRHVTATDPAPKITLNISSLNGATAASVLPDSGADISAAGEEILVHLNEHIDNLLPSTTVPKATNGTEMHPVGKLPICLKLGNTEFSNDLHNYPNVCGILISWKACKNLPDCYPHPPASTKAICTTTLDESPINIISTDAGTSMLTKDSISNEFPRVFDGIIRAMDGEQFHIHLTSGAKPFCVTSSRSILFVYRDKLATELELLQEQHIIAPVTEPTDWCALIVVTSKKNSDSIRMCVDLSHLNRFVRRERYQSCSPAEVVADMAANNAKFFTMRNSLQS